MVFRHFPEQQQAHCQVFLVEIDAITKFWWASRCIFKLHVNEPFKTLPLYFVCLFQLESDVTTAEKQVTPINKQMGGQVEQKFKGFLRQLKPPGAR